MSGPLRLGRQMEKWLIIAGSALGFNSTKLYESSRSGPRIGPVQELR